MTTFNQASPALAVDSDTGLTHMVWNQDGQVWSAYYDEVAQHWVNAAPIPGSVSGLDLQLNTNVGVVGADGNVTTGLIATWTNGDGNDAEAYGAVALASPLGGYQWSNPVNLTRDQLSDSHLQVAVTDDGRVTLVSRKSDASDPMGTAHLSASTLTIQHDDLVFDQGATAPFILGSDLPEASSQDPGFAWYIQNYNFDVGYRFKNLFAVPKPNDDAAGAGGQSSPFELDIRFRGGYQVMDPSLGGLGNNSSAWLGRVEVKLSYKLFNKATIAGYVQGLVAFGGPDPGDQAGVIGARLNFGIQGKVEWPLVGGSVTVLGKEIALEGGWVFDFRAQQNNLWRPSTSSELGAPDFSAFMSLVNLSDGSPARVGEDPSLLGWKIDPTALSNLLFGSSSDSGTPGPGVPLSYHSQWQLSPGFGGWAKATLSNSVNGKASLILYVDFISTDGGPLHYNDLRTRFDVEAVVGGWTFRFRYEQNFLTSSDEGTMRAHGGKVSFDPRPEGGALLDAGGILGSVGAAEVPHSLAVLADGTMVMAWVQDAPNDSGHLTNIAVATSTDGGQTWSTPVILAGSAGINVNPVVAIDGQGRAVVTWNNADDSSFANTPPGHAYVVFGSSALASVGSLDLGALNGSNGFALTGGALLSAIGAAVSGAGDLNGDGIADLVAGAPDATLDTGKAYVVFGKSGLGAGGSIDVSTLDGTNGFVIEGLPYSQLGTSVHRAGDVNGDGFDDLIVGAPGAGDGTTAGDGSAYVILGHSGGFGTNGVLDVSKLDGSTGFRLGTGVRYDAVGTSVGGGSDINGDGLADMVTGAPGVNGGAGAYYVVFGKSGIGSGGAVDLTTLDGSNGFKIFYSNTPANQPTQVPLGSATSLTGDLNGDGKSDLIVTSDGLAFVVFSGAGLGAGGQLDLYQPGSTKVLTIDGIGKVGLAALSVSQAGDINGDGFNDLIIGAGATVVNDQAVPGSSYVIFGSATLQDSATLKLEDLNGKNGFEIVGAGFSVSGTGDVNKDGFIDLLVSDPTATVGNNDMAGKSYVVFGSATLGASGTVDLATLPAGSLLQLTGADADDASGTSVRGITDVNGDGIPDLLIGAPQSVNQTDLDEAMAASQQMYAVLSNGTWSASTLLPGLPEGPKSPSSMQVLPDGRLLLIWVAADPSDADQEQLNGVFWNGSWGTSFVIATGNFSSSYDPRIAQVGDQTMVMWTEILPDPETSNNDQLQLKSSSYNGSTWSAPAAAHIAPSVIPTQVYGNGQQLNLPHAEGKGSVLKIADTAIVEQDGFVSVRITRSGDLSQALTVSYATKDGSATGGSDYESAKGTVTFGVGESERTVDVRIVDDSDGERRNETFALRLWSSDPEAYVSNGAGRLDQETEISAVVTLMDDEPTNLAAIGSGFVLTTDAKAGVGQSVAAAGDVNGDGIADFVIGAPVATTGNNVQAAGKVYVLYGSSSIGTADANLNVDTLNGSNGTILNGLVANGQAGLSLSAADFDKDGKTDIAIGAPQSVNDLKAPPGTVYVVHGSGISGASKDLDSSTAKVLTTETSYSLAGAALASGDINNDGTADLIIGAPGSNKVYVVFGQALAGTGTLNLDALTSTQGFVLTGGTGFTGKSVGVADLNGDGIKDILVGAPNANPVAPQDDPEDVRGMGGQVYVVFGRSGMSGPIDLSKLNGSNGLALMGQHEITAADDPDNPGVTLADSAGASVSLAGDLNGDGKDDIIIGAPNLAPGGTSTLGGAYILFGGGSWNSTSGTYQLANINGQNGLVAAGVPAGTDTTSGNAGAAVSAAGDLNGDGIDDLMVGAPTLNTQGPNSNTGQAAVLFGTRDWTPFLTGNSVDLSSIPLDSRVFSFNGTISAGNTAVAVANAGDVNNDGRPDMLIGAPTAGQAYVAFGHTWMAPGGSLDVSKLRSDNGFVYTPPGNTEVGTVRAAGDLNGDGYADLLVAQSGPGGTPSGQVDIVFGSDPLAGIAPLPALSVTLDTNGSVAGSQSVGHGDFNGDGVTDLVIGTTGSSFATIVFGSVNNDSWSATGNSVKLSGLLATHGGVTVNNSQFASVSFSIVGAADVNGDGYDDLIVSSGNSYPFVLFGQGWHAGSTNAVTVPAALNGQAGFMMRSALYFNSMQVNKLGDLNGDGYDDFGVVGQASEGTNGYVVFGSIGIGAGGTLDLDALNGTAGFWLQGGPNIATPHNSITAAGDINGDGLGDFVVAFAQNSVTATGGTTYVVFGGTQLGAGGLLDLASLPGTAGFHLTSGTAQNLGYSITAAGDVNGDGFGDLLVGAPSVNGSTKGESYVLFGAAKIGASGSVSVDNLSGTSGFSVVGASNNAFSGSSLGGPADINGDGFADLLIGAQGSSAAGVSGAAFAAFGGDFTGSTTQLGTAGDDILQATVQATVANPVIMNGREGDDILESIGSAATSPHSVVMIGGEGDDILAIGGLSFRALDGGTGTDTLMLNPFLMTSNNLDLTNPDIGGRIHGIEVIDLGIQNRMTASLPTLLQLSDTTNTWMVKGEGSRVVVPIAEQWLKAGSTVVVDNITYDSWSYKSATILLQQGNFFQKAVGEETGAAAEQSPAEEPVVGGGQVFLVTNTNDSGAGSLRQAILDAGKHDGRDTIDLTQLGSQTIHLGSGLTLSIGNDLDFIGSALGVPTISGSRLFTVSGANISFTSIHFAQGSTLGGSGSGGGGGGLGAGAALNILSGSVTLESTFFNHNTATGGSAAGNAGGGGFGGQTLGNDSTSGSSGSNGGGYQGGGGAPGGAGGAANDASGNPGANGGSGGFGVGGGGGGGGAGGNSNFTTGRYAGSSGGTGGGGGFGAGSGGGGGGGGSGVDTVGNPLSGGQGPGGGAGGTGSDGLGGSGNSGGGGASVRSGADGGQGGGGAGLGGAIFVYAGANLTVNDSTFVGNSAIGGTGAHNGQGKGGAIVAVHGATVVGSNLTFIDNFASDAANHGSFSGYDVPQDNNDVYGTINSANPHPEAILGTAAGDELVGTEGDDFINAGDGDDTIDGGRGDDTLVSGWGHDTYVFRPDSASDIVAGFTGLFRAPSDEVVAEADVLTFDGAGMTARNLRLVQDGMDTQLWFDGVAGFHLTLKYVNRQSLANLSASLGNILFHGDTIFQDSFEVWADGYQGPLRPGIVTFLDDRDHTLDGFDSIDDVINGGAGRDALSGLGGNDILRGEAGNDVLCGGAGADSVDLGSGTDIVRDTLGDLNGDVISGFGLADALDVAGARHERGAFSFTSADSQTEVRIGASTFALKGDFTNGDFMAVARGTGEDAHTVMSFVSLLPALAEGVSVDPARINGVANEPFLSGDGATRFTVELKSAVSAHANALGYYEIGADGTIGDVHMLFDNTLNVAAGKRTIDLGTPADGQRIAFFLIQDGFDRYGNLRDDLSFVAPGGTTPADVDAALAPVLRSATLGNLTSGPIFHSIAALNPGDVDQVLSGTSAGGLELLMGFEDLPSASGDNDFQDVIIGIRTEGPLV